VGVRSESKRDKEKEKRGIEGKAASRLWCFCSQVFNDRVQSSGPTGLRPAICPVIPPDRHTGTIIEVLLGHTTCLNEGREGGWG